MERLPQGSSCHKPASSSDSCAGFLGTHIVPKTGIQIPDPAKSVGGHAGSLKSDLRRKCIFTSQTHPVANRCLLRWFCFLMLLTLELPEIQLPTSLSIP